MSLTNKILSLFKKNHKDDVLISTELSKMYLDDITYIRDIYQIQCGSWEQYDVVMNTWGYSWETMIEWADYLIDADIENLDQVTIGGYKLGEINLVNEYKKVKKCKRVKSLEEEQSTLGIAGKSKVLKQNIKIVWINQTNRLRLFAMIKDIVLIEKYLETVIRRTFGTENQMKLGKPISKK